jgi:hypothetical protein
MKELADNASTQSKKYVKMVVLDGIVMGPTVCILSLRVD